jgi:hypothetical protein
VEEHIMTLPKRHPRLPGTTLLTIARPVFDQHHLATIVEPTIADLQQEIAAAGARRGARLRARWRGYRAFWTILLLSPCLSSSAQQAHGGLLASGAIVVGLLAVGDPVWSAWIAPLAATGR